MMNKTTTHPMHQNKPLIVFVITSALSESLVAGVELFYQQHGRLFNVRIFSTHDIEEEVISTGSVAQGLESADMVFLDIRGGGKANGVCTRVLPRTDQPVALLLGGTPEIMALLRLGSFSMKTIMEKSTRETSSKNPTAGPNLASIQRMMGLIEKGGSLLPFGKLRHARNWARLMKYWQQGGAENIKNLLILTAIEYLGFSLPKPAQPVTYPDFGIFDPLSGQSFTDLKAFRQARGFDPEKPTVGLLFYGGMHFSQSLVPAKAFAERLSRMGLNLLPIFANAGFNLKAIQTCFFSDGNPTVDAVVYFQWFQLATFMDSAGETTVTLLKKLNVPVFSACPMFGREIRKWEDSDQGLSPIETLTTVILPELDGMIEPLPSAGLIEKTSDTVEGHIQQVAAIEDRVERACNRISRWLILKAKPNAEKRVAFIVFDNPPGEDNLGSAAYLDTFASLRNLFEKMTDKGYTVTDLPKNQSLHEYFLARRLVNSPHWGGEDTALKTGGQLTGVEYESLLDATVPGADVTLEWGPLPGDIMTLNGNFILPAVEFGNILLGIQPTRGFHADPDKISHDKTLPPHHQYLAFYRWLEEVWQADCIVHVGTHGTLEFLKGKEMGMSRNCFPEALIGNVPHLYFYHVINASEATIAKRRSLGVLISYNSPSFAVSGLYDQWDPLDQLIAECLEAAALEPDRAKRLERQVIEKAAGLHLGSDSLCAIQEEIALMKRSIIPKGLHRLGEDVPEKDCITFAVFFLRYDRGEIPSLHRLLAEGRGLDYEALLCPGRAKPGDVIPGRALEEIEAEVAAMVREAWEKGTLPDTEPARTAVANAVKAARNLTGGLELDNFFNGLSGAYIEPALGGDPLRNPEILPTGRNSFQFDPRLVPSEEACRRGMEIAENTLAHYQSLNGSYPDSTAVILWGFETTKTRGETVGQILGYLGVRVIQNSNPYHKKIEAISSEELGRPRIDCLVQICGFFRDMYPNVMDLLNRAFQLVSKLDEPQCENHVRRNTLSLKAVLSGKVADHHLNRIAAGRIFGPRAGEYGTRTTHLIETGAWKNEEEISELFTASMSHLYADNIHGERHVDVYRKRLSAVDLVSQVRDSHEYEVGDLDHYYEFFGGLSRTVESVKGKAPVMLITDTTKEVIRTETVAEALNRGIRTRLLNPKWIDALLEHEYHGAQKIADRVENLIGFAATTHAVDNWIWSSVTDRYIRDENMFERMTQNNRFALEEILKRLLEADRRGYWQATKEEKDLLRDRYLELEGKIEEKIEP
jgi:cobaltochelatase CobN